MAGVRKSSPSATGVEMGCVVKVDPMQKKKKNETHTLAVYYHTTKLHITKPGLSPGFVMHKGIPIAIV